jgi:hypothetical protein
LTQCFQIFGGDIIPLIGEANLNYGAADIQATNVFYSNYKGASS